MTITQKFSCNVLEFAPELSICKIDSSSNELHNLLYSSKLEDNGYNISIILTQNNKKLLIDGIVKKNFETEFHYFEIKDQEQIIFKAYDGFEIGEVSKQSILSEKLLYFIDNKICIIK